MTTASENQQEARSMKIPLTGPKQEMNTACWNVRTLYQVGKTRELTNKLERYKLDICGISECRWNKSGKSNLNTGESVIYSGGEEHKRGVAITMSEKAAKSLQEWQPINKRVISATFNSKYVKLTIIQCYAPTNDDKEEPKHHITIIMGDFNAKVGNTNEHFERTMGKEGLGEMNDNGNRLAEYCSENDLIITGTCYKHRYTQGNMDLA